MSLWLALACSPEPVATPHVEARGDRVLVIVDTLRSDALENMPSVRGVAGVEFERAYSASSWTLPSTATLLTGLGPWEHRVVRDPFAPDGEGLVFGQLGPEPVTLAETWAAEGYRRGAFINNTFLAPEFGLGRGFEVYDWQGAGPVEHRTAADTVQTALKWLDESDEPAFLVVHMMEPHADYVPPDGFRGRHSGETESQLEAPLGDHIVRWMRGEETPSKADQDYVRALYTEEVEATDAAIGQLVEGLKTRGRWDETVFVVTSDHGEEFWENGGFEHGHSLLSEVTHVPLVVRAPDLERGSRADVVDAREVAAMLSPGARGQAARLGDGVELALTEGILYGDEYFTVVTPDRRIEACLEPDCRTARVWAIADGVEPPAPLTPGPEVNALLREHVAWARSQRGHLDPTRPAHPIAALDKARAQQLEALGYVEH